MAWPIQAYLDERGLELSPRTIATYRWALRDAERRTGVPIQALSARHLLELSNSWRRNDQLLSHLRTFLRWAGHPLAEKVPHGIPPETRRRLVWYTIAELEAAVDACRTPRERLVLHLACELMLRRIEIERLTWADLEPMSIRVLGKGRHGGKVRRIPWHPYTRSIVSAYTAGATYTATSHLGHESAAPARGTTAVLGLRRSALDKEMKRIGARAGLHLEFHALRRTGGRLFVQAGVGIGKGPLEVLNELRGLYGHEDLRTTMRYIGWELESAGATLAAMPVLERSGVPARAPAPGPAVPTPDPDGPSGMTYHRPRRTPPTS